MADSLVSGAHTSALSQRNSEPTHLSGASYETLGGRTPTSVPNSDEDKINAGAGVSGQDTSIPKAVGPEPSHLKSEDSDDAEVSFDGDDEDLTEGDDLDKELDQFESLEEPDVDVDLDEEDDKEDEDKGDNPFVKEDGDEEDDKGDLKEDENPFEKKDDDAEEVKEEEGDSTDSGKLPLSSVQEDEDADDEKEKVEESLKIRVKIPAVTLSESVIPAKKQKAVRALFEQHVRAVTKQIAKQVSSHYKKLHESKIAKRDAAMAKQMDAYLSYVVEEWVKANRVSIRQSLRTQLAEEFLTGLQRLFKEHYIDVPESKVDVVRKLTEQNEKLKSKLTEQHASKMKLKKLAEAANKARIVAEFGATMSEAERAKLSKLAESTSYKNSKDFRAKLAVLKENYFPKTEKRTKDLPAENVQVIKEETKKTADASVDPDIAAINEALRRSAGTKW